jgi:ankyrin repeat protein
MNDEWVSALRGGELSSVRRHLAENPSLATTPDRRLDTINGRCDVFPLRFAVSQNHREIAVALLKAGADVNARDPHGNMLQAADHVEMVDLLIENGADVNAMGYESGNAVILASYKAQAEKLERLIAHGADVNQPAGNDGRTALHVAAGWGYKGASSLTVVRVLLKNGADINARDKSHQSPLHWAVQQGNKDAVELLLQNGADRAVRDSEGKTPLDYSDNDDISTLLKAGEA